MKEKKTRFTGDELLTMALSNLPPQEKFENFLRNSGCKEIYWSNFNSGAAKDFRKIIGANITKVAFLKNNDPIGYIGNAFSWSEMPKGPNYWFKLHVEWARKCGVGEDLN